jgi:hypothetical protein
MMKRCISDFTALGFMLAVLFLAAIPVRAQTPNIDERIKALEHELFQLKEEQIELKKEATSAAAALPNFTYRPGNGVLIESADKSWGIRFGLESHFRMEFLSGRDQVGRSNGEIMLRRFRPQVIYCINNCLYEIEATLDLDGWGTNSALQRGALNIHFEHLNPWLPTFVTGGDISTASAGSLSRQGSGAVGAQAEYDLHTRNNGFNTGRSGHGIVLNWDDRALTPIGIPGRIGRFQLAMASIGEGDDNTQSNTDRKDFSTYISIQPFSAIKNKWIQGFTFEYGHWFCNVDNRAAANACNRYRVQDHGDGARQTLFDSGANSIGQGLHQAYGPGIVWSIGPYTLRSMGVFQRSEDRGTGIGGVNVRGRKKAHNFLVAHDLFLWSPKGFLTGSNSTPGSILLGTHFERVDMSVDCGQGSGFTCPNIGTLAQFHRNRILLREWDLFYFLAPRMSIGVHFLWYDASNLNNGVNQAGHNLGECRRVTATTTNCRTGKGGDWIDVLLNYRYTW